MTQTSVENEDAGLIYCCDEFEFSGFDIQPLES